MTVTVVLTCAGEVYAGIREKRGVRENGMMLIPNDAILWEQQVAITPGVLEHAPMVQLQLLTLPAQAGLFGEDDVIYQ